MLAAQPSETNDNNPRIKLNMSALIINSVNLINNSVVLTPDPSGQQCLLVFTVTQQLIDQFDQLTHFTCLGLNQLLIFTVKTETSRHCSPPGCDATDAQAADRKQETDAQAYIG